MENTMKKAGGPIKRFLNDFKNFAMQGNVLDLAVGVMIGGAFGKIVSSLVSDIFMPLIGLLTGGIDLNNLFFALDGKHYVSVQAATDAGVGTLNYGAFLTNVIDFILIALCVFLFVRLITKMMPKKPEAPATPMRECPFCKTQINAAATRCPDCTSEVTPVDPAAS
ncbi:large conductance mechanosensitive channel protein MscL [Eubacteriales bacterium OttesenSCG-928-A19]|nr:large conductance mechanosensitive channel protein MscL [Eubacteriales bacterium OttesenSCG-928-A19]